MLPCLNEEETLAGCLREIFETLRASGISAEVIVADNCSHDNSRSIAESHGARVVCVGRKGYGRALRGGVDASMGRFILMGDADGSYDFSCIPDFVVRLREGFGLVMGNRFLGGIEKGAMPWKNRFIGNPALSGIARLFFRCPVHDLHCGIRAFSREAYDRMGLVTEGMEFATEMVIKATSLGVPMVEIPAILRKDRRSRMPHLKPWRDGWRHLRFMLLFSPKWLFLFPGIFLSATGVFVGSLLLTSPVRLGSIVLDYHTAIYAGLFVLIGVQSISFSAMAKVFAVQSGLLPEDLEYKTVVRVLKLESGAFLGGGLMVVGVGLSLKALSLWKSAAFGEIVGRDVLIWVIPGSSLIALGFFVVLASFFLSLLRFGDKSNND